MSGHHSAKQPYRVFISHSSDDIWIADQIRRHVEATGSEAFLDEKDVQKGDEYRAVLLREVG